MPGALDSNGIYQYDESDLASPFSDLLNLGQTATSDVVAALDSRLDVLEQGTGLVPVLRIYGSAGTATWTKSAHLLGIRVRAYGAGGGGAGAGAAGANNSACGSGGGSGGYSEAWFDAGALTSTVTVTVAAGGAGGVGAANGTTASDTSFGSYVVVHGGGGGQAITASTTHGTVASGGGAAAIGTITGQSGAGFSQRGSVAVSPMRVSNGSAAVMTMRADGAPGMLGGGGAGGINTGGGNAYNLSAGGGGCEARSAGPFTGGIGGGGLVLVEEFYKVV